jgi:hypothetical protein
LCDRCEIEELIFHCAELADAGEFVAYSELFRYGVMIGHDGVTRDAKELLQHRLDYNLTFGEVTPKTAHVLTNVRIRFSSDRKEARSQCYVTGYFLHETDKPLVPNYLGQYFDRFQQIDGRWFFKERRVAPIGAFPKEP